jgi:hypothetical protein
VANVVTGAPLGADDGDAVRVVRHAIAPHLCVCVASVHRVANVVTGTLLPP